MGRSAMLLPGHTPVADAGRDTAGHCRRASLDAGTAAPAWISGLQGGGRIPGDFAPGVAGQWMGRVWDYPQFLWITLWIRQCITWFLISVPKGF
jgi:hypothetical protein